MGIVDLCIENAKIVNGDNIIEVDVAIDDGKIVSISKSSKLLDADERINLRGSLLLPGIVDVHVHFRDPGLTRKEDFITGSRSAAAGGVTTVCDMPNTSPPTDSLERFEEKRRIAECKSHVDFGLHGMLTNNIDEGKRILDSGAVSLKLYPELHEDSSVLKFQDKGVTITAHPEDPDILDNFKVSKGMENNYNEFLRVRPRKAEVSEVSKLLDLNSSAHLHLCHVTTRDSLKLIYNGKINGNLSCEVTPHHLFLDKSSFKEWGTVAKTHPPLRSVSDRIALFKALENGLIDIFATDHAPHTLEEKQMDFIEAPPGSVGVEISLPLLFSMVKKGKITLSRLIEVMCSNPARIFGLFNDEGVLKGTLQQGADADLVAINQSEKWEIKGENLHGKTKFTPFEGREVVGKPFLTLVRGEIVFKEDEVVGRKGHGEFIPARTQA